MKPAVRSAVLAALAIVAAGLVWLASGREQSIQNLWTLLASLIPFVLAAETIASLRPHWFQRGRLIELCALGAFLVVFCFLVPKIFAAAIDNDFDKLYSWMRILVPLLILCLALMLRLGGAAPAVARRVSYAGILVMLSGIEDLAFQLLRGKPLAAQWDWADHMTVRLGHVASRNEALAFIVVHLLLAGLVLFLPDRFWHRLGGGFRRRTAGLRRGANSQRGSSARQRADARTR
ncbi:hypothetical protein [Nocardia altamirensis]|uniref:hypothetical protein n=1 Tax=Nocardia altamirensis TaxID=472158 RepID=UPI00084078E0|nr:hypothetical protein [Nocardia altamirensis]